MSEPDRPTINSRERQKRKTTALPPSISVFLKQLTLRPGGRVLTNVRIDASELFRELDRDVLAQRGGLDARSVTKVQSAVIKWTRRSQRAKFSHLVFSDETVLEAARLWATLIKLRASVTSGLGAEGKKRGSGTARILHSAKPALDALLELCRKAESLFAWAAFVDLCREISEASKLPLRDYLTEERFSQVYSELVSQLLRSLEDALGGGDLGRAEALFSRFHLHEGLRKQAVKHLGEIIANRSANMPTSSQEWALVKSGLRDKPQGQTFVYSSLADDPGLQQAAGLLLLMWDHSSDSSANREAFERLRELCRIKFHLELKGSVGDTVNYDSRLHEARSQAVPSMKLVRPWVEYVNPPESRIVIRGLVDPS